MQYIPEILLGLLTIVQISLPSAHSTVAFIASVLLFATKTVKVKANDDELKKLNKDINELKDRVSSLSFKR